MQVRRGVIDPAVVIDELKTAYWTEMETAQNYLVNSVKLEGVRGVEIREALVEDIGQELGHAKRLAIEFMC